MFELVTERYPAGSLLVVSFRALEELSKPYSCDVLVLGRQVDASTIEGDLLRQRAHFHIAAMSEAPRVIHGLIRRVTAMDSWGGYGEHAYRVRLGPRMHLLSRSQGTRIFQSLDVRAIVSSILDEWRVCHRWSLLRPPAPREYCVQYLESDLSFVTRLLAEEGIFYWFEHPHGEDTEEVVVFGDGPHAIQPIDGDPHLLLRDPSGMHETEEHIRHFEVRERVRPLGTLLKEFDFMRPSHDVRASSGPSGMFDGLAPFVPSMISPDAMAAAGVPMSGVPEMDGPPDSMIPDAAGIPGAPDAPGPDDLAAELAGMLPRRPYGGGHERIYEHLGEIDRLGVDMPMAERHLEAERARARVGDGESRCRRLWPGRSFTLHGAALPAHDGTYTVVRVTHEGHDPTHERSVARDVYRNTFRCVPHHVAPRPRRRKRRLQQVLETATVVGPPGSEIHTDEHGRIKVQFHWDLEGIYTQFSSCWIRVMQAWSGAAWGFQFIPRIGMEVLVTFVGGDVDRPMVLGCVPNAEHPMPFPLPRNKTKSGIRTKSTRWSEGYNEISFEDRKGREKLFIRAQKDMDEVVAHTQSVAVGADQTTRIGANQTLVVDGARFDVVAQNRVTDVGGDRTVRIGGDERLTVDRSSSCKIGADAQEHVEGTREAYVKGRSVHYVGESHYTRVRGSYRVFVGEQERPAGATTYVWGDYRMASSKTIIVDGIDGVTVQCGDSAITVKDDEVRISAAKLVLAGTEEVVVECGGSRLKLDGQAELLGSRTEVHSTGASVELGDDAVVRGSHINLRRGRGETAQASAAQSPAPGTRRIHLVLADAESAALANRRYQLIAEGTRHAGTTGGDGSLQHDVPETATAASLRLWLNDRDVIDYHLELATELPPVATPRGALTRLRTLGYFTGEVGDELTPAARESLRFFQADQGLDDNGELDGPTQSKLQQVARS
jgi:type VI secretion system secreted protein VgrG